MDKQSLLSGIDILLLDKPAFRQERLALVTNDATSTKEGKKSRIALIEAGFNIVQLFSPEHGLSAKGEDGKPQLNGVDPLTNLPVTSLYGEQLAPSQNDLASIDIVIFDIADAGCRFYTYLWTMTHVMQACATFNKRMIILDRPNPISGEINVAEGPWLDEAHCSSFIGRWNIPVRHSCTLGELAGYFSKTRIPGFVAEIITVRNWKRNSMVLSMTGEFLAPSPAIRDRETALLYSGMGLLEGVNVNEGRGTATPFKVCGAPWIDEDRLKKEFDMLRLPGISSKAINYSPVEGLYQNEKCNGLQFFVNDPLVFRPVRMGLELIRLLSRLHPDQLAARLYPTNANPGGKDHLNKLTGIYKSFERVIQSSNIESLTNVKEWAETIAPYLLY